MKYTSALKVSNGFKSLALHAALGSTENMKLISMKKQSTIFNMLSALAITVSYADRSNLSSAIIPMTKIYDWSPSFRLNNY